MNILKGKTIAKRTDGSPFSPKNNRKSIDPEIIRELAKKAQSFPPGQGIQTILQDIERLEIEYDLEPNHKVTRLKSGEEVLEEIIDAEALKESPNDPNPLENDVENHLQSTFFEVGASSSKGRRKKNEDAYTVISSLPEEPHTAFFGVYDGHGGKKASSYCKKKLHTHITKQECFSSNKTKALIDGFIEADDKFLEKFEEDGTTVVVALLNKQKHLWVANAGDSRCVVYKSDGRVIPMSEDHKPSDEKEKKRIEAAGHEVMKDTIILSGKRVEIFRIDGRTAVSRAIGDMEYKDYLNQGPEKQAICCIPDVKEENLSKGDYIVLACDGIWDVMTNEQVGNFIQQHKSAVMEDLAANLVKEAITLGSTDNLTIIVVKITE